MMFDEAFSSLELFAAVYPAANSALRLYGIRPAYGRALAMSLDWSTILVHLHAEGFVVPGPTIGRTSFWLLTGLYRSDYFSMWLLLQRLVGSVWAEAALQFINTDAVTGPVLHRRRNTQSANDQDRKIRYAFRLMHEPVAWSRRCRHSESKVVGRMPERWRLVPWYVPNLQDDRRSLTDERRMGAEEPEDPTVKADLDTIEDIRGRMSDAADPNDLFNDLAILQTMMDRVGQDPVVFTKTKRFHFQVLIARDNAIAKRVEIAINNLTAKSAAATYDDIAVAIKKMQSIDFREFWTAELHRARLRFQGHAPK